MVDYDIIVIGAGSAGLTVAIGGAGIGAKVLLVEKEKIGGDCTHHGCVPSKSLIKAGRVAKQIKDLEKYGLSKSKEIEFDLEKIMKKVNSTVEEIYSHETPEKIRSYGVDVELGDAKFVNKNTISVSGKEFSAKHIVIATGSRARIPDTKGLSDIKYMTNKEIFDPKKFKSIAIMGAGPIGCELGQAFNNLGIKVYIINTADQILSREDKDAADLVESIFEEEGINLRNNHEVFEIKDKGKTKVLNLSHVETNKIESIEVDEVLVSVGRVPNIEGLNLEKAEVEYDKRGIKINAKGQTSNKKIYAVGDVNGGMQFTHLANSQGKSSLASIIFKLNAKFETEVIPRVTFTTPEIASIGINEKDKLDSDLILFKEYKDIDRAITDSDLNGFFKIIVDKKGFVKGACLVGEGSGELIGEIAVAMKNKIKISNVSDTIHPYPTYGYGLRNTCDGFRGNSYTENKKKWVKRIFGLRGK